jgi:hypothetical protein
MYTCAVKYPGETPFNNQLTLKRMKQRKIKQVLVVVGISGRSESKWRG